MGGRAADKTPRFLSLLDEMADEIGVTPVISRRAMAESFGVTECGLSSLFGALQQRGCIVLVEPGKPGMIGRYRITGEPYRPQARDNRIIPKPVVIKHDAPPTAPNAFDDAEIARRLRDQYGIEVTRRIGRFGEPISLPRVRALEGPMP